jgi:hypothetical protein
MSRWLRAVVRSSVCDLTMRALVHVCVWITWVATLLVYGLAMSASAMYGIPQQPWDSFLLPSLRAYRETGLMVRQIERYLSVGTRA